MKLRAVLSIILLFSSLVVFSSPLGEVAEGQRGASGASYLFVYNLRTQFRRLKVHFTEQSDTLTLHWTYTNDSGTRGGAFAMPKQSREHATQICYIMPTADKTIVTPDNELFAMISRDALKTLKQDGKCRYNNTTLTLLETIPQTQGKPSLLHVRDYDEGYEMWIEDNLDFPLIHKMINNPVEIDWNVEIIENN